jgi:hypothetical protein
MWVLAVLAIPFGYMFAGMAEGCGAGPSGLETIWPSSGVSTIMGHLTYSIF